MSNALTDGRSLRVMHVLRAPLGGLFRHVVDLTRAQIARGHAVGLIADSLTGGAQADTILAELAPSLQLGLLRFPIRRNPHPSDFAALLKTYRAIEQYRPDVIHGHGSKGGLFARLTGFLPGGPRNVRAYTPHGGSFNYRPGTVLHSVYMSVEAVLARRTDILLFESAYIGRQYDRYVAVDGPLKHQVLNGISRNESEPVIAHSHAADLLYVGELRAAKGIDTLLDALVIVRRDTGNTPRVILVGSGPDTEALIMRVKLLGLTDYVSFKGPMPARRAFAMGRILVVPSRAESLPYIVLEGAAARIPMIATSVGGIPEIFGPHAHRLIPCDQPAMLAARMVEEMNRGVEERDLHAFELAQYVTERFSIDNMVEAVLRGYCDAIAAASRPSVAMPIPASS